MMDTTSNVALQFIHDRPLYQSEKPYRMYKITPPEGLSTTNVDFEEHQNVPVQDLRGRQDKINFGQDSFEFIRAPGAVVLDDTQDSIRAFCNEQMDLIRTRIDAERIITYEVLRRHSKAKTGASTMKHSLPINIVHIDHTEEGGKQRISRHLTQAEQATYSGPEWRWRIVNVWRPLCDVVKDAPLAVLHPRSIDPTDILEVDQIGPHYVGETCYLKHNDRHEWFWLSDQTRDEALLFTSFDTHPPSAYATSCPHASFKCENVPEDAPPRESVELRCIVISKV